MKKIVYLFSMVVMAVGVAACSSSARDSANKDQSFEKVEKAKKLTVATSGTLYPSSYYNDQNELTGYDVDIIKEVAKRLDVEVVFKEYNVDGQITSVAKGESDLAANDFSLNGERKKSFF